MDKAEFDRILALPLRRLQKPPVRAFNAPPEWLDADDARKVKNAAKRERRARSK